MTAVDWAIWVRAPWHARQRRLHELMALVHSYQTWHHHHYHKRGCQCLEVQPCD